MYKVTVIDKSIGKGSQDVNYKEVVRVLGKKLMIEIKSDSYEFQSYAKVSIFSGEKWNMVHNIHYSNMSTKGGLAYLPRTVVDSDFIVDRDNLLNVATKII